MTIRTSFLRRDETHRLIPYRPGQDSALNRLADEDRELQDLFELDSATNERLLGEANQLRVSAFMNCCLGSPTLPS